MPKSPNVFFDVVTITATSAGPCHCVRPPGMPNCLFLTLLPTAFSSFFLGVCLHNLPGCLLAQSSPTGSSESRSDQDPTHIAMSKRQSKRPTMASTSGTPADFVGMYDFEQTIGTGQYSVVKRATVSEHATLDLEVADVPSPPSPLLWERTRYMPPDPADRRSPIVRRGPPALALRRPIATAYRILTGTPLRWGARRVYRSTF